MRRRSGHVAAVLLCCFVVCGVLSQPSFGLVNTSDHPDYRNAPTDDPGWDNVGQMSNGTGIYLGDGWVLTPYHVYKHEAGHSHIQLDRRYDEILGTSQRIEFDDLGRDADLVMFRINGNPDLDLIEIREAALPDGELATIISTGRMRVPDSVLQEWDIQGHTYSGYETIGARVKQWGTNRITNLTDPVIPPGGYGTTHAFLTMFDTNPSQADETQPVDKDSGGVAFTKLSGNSAWELTGVVISLAMPAGYPYDELRPETHAIYGNGAFYADLTTYYDQISANRLIALPGDADWNGRVDLVDFGMLRGSFGQSGPGIRTDFNNDLIVDDDDLEILENNFGMVSGSGIVLPGSGAPAMAPVLAPEPATIFVLIGGFPLLLKSRTRRRRT